MKNLLIQTGLTEKEKVITNDWYSSLDEKNQQNIESILKVAENASNKIFNFDLDFNNVSELFFNIYVAGSKIAHPNNDSDLDIMVVTNYKLPFGEGFSDVLDEPFYDTLLKELGNKFEIVKQSELPTSYNLAELKGKCLIKLKPLNSKITTIIPFRDKIDITYVRSPIPYQKEGFSFGSEEDFLKLDVYAKDELKGKDIPKLLLYRKAKKLNKNKINNSNYSTYIF